LRRGTAGTPKAAACAFVAAAALILTADSPPARADEEPLPDVQTLIRDLGLVVSPTRSRDHPGWRAPRKILVRAGSPELIERLREVAPGVEIVPVDSAREAASKAAGADAVLGFCDADVLAKGPQIRWIQSFYAGVEECVGIPAVRERDILVTNMQRVAGPVMAEHVLAMMLAFTRGLEFFIPERMAGRWSDELPLPRRMQTLEGKTVLVVGLGGIGTEVAKRAHAFGMKVVATRASGREGPEYVSYVGLPDELLKLAGDADFIVNTTPLTPETTRIFDAKFFAAAKRGAYFFNVGRGGSVAQDDLVRALRDGRLAGAGLDVTDPEPLPADSPLWKLPNVILTPHVAADTDAGRGARYAIVRENLRRYVAGEPLISVVDLRRGY
jgi:phosphoglycerate dehydrogenase-like enzyme